MRVTIVDSIMGKGKTSWALQYINESPAYKKFIYITPFLDEVERVIKSTPGREFFQPNNANNEGRKLRSLKELIVSGKNICATHSLFKSADEELIELLTEAGYTLILDEVMDVIETANITSQDIKALRDLGYIDIVNNRVRWVYEDYVEGRFYDIKLLAKAGNLFYHRDKFLIWAFPPKVFSAFDNVFVLTYLFNVQLQSYYYKLHDINYEIKSVSQDSNGRYNIGEYDPQREERAEVMKLIDIYNGPYNEVGEARNAFSVSWFRNASDTVLERVQKNIYSYFRNHCKVKGNELIWTTVKKNEIDLRGKGYAKSFTPVNLRATNEYSDRKALAYVFNRYLHPIERAFFEDNGITVNQDLLAVSDLLQWIWRSRIRNGESISLYLPSSRMRSLLKAWGSYEI
ncbi:hypothetical protein [Caldalkalibacillus mannanilyticus]|uniref:hypothetical protein n=1 Tax=Caldalkalibacillus mannanilyticus TaxID=1418 RepID=UPI00046A3075|nr:hypothetical protein [Caldalkalibacillus mannanilyticus]